MTVLVHVSQSCTIGGRAYRIGGSSITSALNSNLSMRFICEADPNAAAGRPAIGEMVEIVQVGNGTQSFLGRVASVTAERGVGFTRFAVEAEGLSADCARRRFLFNFGRGSATALVSGGFGLFGPPGVLFVADLISDPVVIDAYSSTYGSLADLVTFAANTTGWSWLCERDQFRFFNPASYPVSGTIAQTDFVAGTLRVAEEGRSVFNVARQQAWEYTTATFTNPIIPEDVRQRAFDTIQVIYCATRFEGPVRLAGLPFDQWEFVEGAVLRGNPAGDFGFGNPDEPRLSEIEVGFSVEDRAVTTDVPLMAPPNADFAVFYRVEIRARFRRLVWTEARLQASIDEFGVRDSPVLPNDGGVDVPESLRRLSEFLQQRAFPPIEIRGDFARTDIRPGERRTVHLHGLGVGPLDVIVSRVTRTFSGDGLAVSVEMRSIGGGSGALAPERETDLMPEVFRRLQRIETSSLNPASPAGAVFVAGGRTPGPITGVVSFTGGMTWAGEFDLDPLVEGISLEEDFGS